MKRLSVFISSLVILIAPQLVTASSVYADVAYPYEQPAFDLGTIIVSLLGIVCCAVVIIGIIVLVVVLMKQNKKTVESPK